ncbi:MAG: hypothetical protein IKE69_09755 [Thermoguttaceae bacterium]|nr:hypothetical protein [Thermoguttaceae bacterium]
MKILPRTIYRRDRRKGKSEEGWRRSVLTALLSGSVFLAVLFSARSPAAADDGEARPSAEIVSESPAPPSLSVSEENAEEFPTELSRPSVYSDARDTRIYHPAESVPSRLAERFMALIPPADRASVDWRADDQERTLTVTAPPQIIATADQLIPRMDANVQLSGDGVEFGVAEPVRPDAVEETEPAPSAGAYYDPNENRMVETRWENRDAIFPVTEEEMGTRVFGGDDARGAKETSPQTADVTVYSCPREKIGLVAAGLKAQYKDSPAVMITSDADDEIILVYAPQALQGRIRQELASVNIAPAAPERRGPAQSVSAPNREPAPVESGAAFRIGYSPVYKSLDALESQLTSLFNDRMTRIFPAPGQGNLTPAERERRVWRFVKKAKSSGAPAPSCELHFEPSMQTILMVGSRSLCEQMRTLIETMDREGHSSQTPYYIQIRNADSEKIESIFRMQNDAIRGQSGSAPVSQAAPKGEISTAEYTASDSDRAPIRPTAAQDDSGDGGASAGDLNMVSDFVPTVLPDLDIVIVDAPPAEAKRITDMIAKIEELAANANPSIEMYQLKHVNSLTLGGVLQRLYSEMFLTKQGRVLAYPMQSPNAILLVGWGKALESMKDLIRTFDQPVESEGSDLHVVFLKHQAARSMAALLTESFPPAASATGGMAPRIRVVADEPTNSLVIQASANDFEEIQRILMEIDVNRSNVKLEVRTFTLKNTLAEDLRQTIAAAIMPAAAGAAARGSMYPILEILSVDAESKKLISSGIMKDVQINANPYKQQLIVTAPADCMELIATLIDELDVPAQTGQLKIFEIRNGDATQMQKTLSSILATNPGGMPSIPNSKGEVSFVPVRFTVDTRTNSILAAGSPGDLRLIDAMITALDRRDTDEQRQLEVIQLRTVRAASVANAINQYLNEKRSLELTSDTISDHQLFESQVIVIPEANTNSIILSATSKYLDDIRAMIEKLDNEPQQVVIQVLIAEVTLSDQEQFGIQAGLQDKVAFDRSIVTNVTNSSSTIGNPGYDFITNNTQGNAYNSATDPEYLAGQILSNFGMGRSDSDLGYGGLVLSASSRSVQVILRALRDKNRLQVLSRPQIQAMDNQQAFILVGQRVPRVSGASTTTYGVTSNVVDANVGLILLVTPRISKDGRVIMEIGAEKSSLGSASDAIPVFSSEGQVITSPTIETTQLMTAVSAQDGETVMLGGMISSTKEKISRGVPYISDIPVLGWLFRYDSDTETRKELLIVMTPRVVANSEDAEAIKRAEARKMSWCLADAMAIHGDMGLNDPLNTRGTSRDTELLPFREMDEMEELPPSTIRSKTSDSQKSENPSLKTARVSTGSSWFKK